MAHSSAHPAGGNVARLRAAIDRGRTGDKAAKLDKTWSDKTWSDKTCSDPAAAPLGTDEEAAGTPLHATVVEPAYVYERDRFHGDPHGSHNGVGLAWWLAVFAAIVGVLLGWAALSL